MKQDMILVLDLGSQENPRLAREIRSLGVYSEIHPHDITLEQVHALPNVKGIIVNGGPNRGRRCGDRCIHRDLQLRAARAAGGPQGRGGLARG